MARPDSMLRVSASTSMCTVFTGGSLLGVTC
jgi:hypothetical protein